MPKKVTKRRKSSSSSLRPVSRNCPFCKENLEPDYKEYKVLAKYINDRDKILGKARTGLCAKHQRGVGRAVKRARHLGLISISATL